MTRAAPHSRYRISLPLLLLRYPALSCWLWRCLSLLTTQGHTSYTSSLSITSSTPPSIHHRREIHTLYTRECDFLDTYIHYSILSISTSPACVVIWYRSLGIFGVVEYRHRHSAGRITPTSTSLNPQSRENSVIRYTLHRTKRSSPPTHIDYSAGRRRRSYTYTTGPAPQLQEYLSALDCNLAYSLGKRLPDDNNKDGSTCCAISILSESSD